MSPVARERLLQRLQTATIVLVRRLGARAYLVLAAVFSLLIVTDSGMLNLVSAAETRLFDLLISHRIATPKPDPEIVILDIDEASLAGMAAEHGRWPWPNRVFGELVDAIEKQKPRAIVFDILFPTATRIGPKAMPRSTRPSRAPPRPSFRCCDWTRRTIA